MEEKSTIDDELLLVHYTLSYKTPYPGKDRDLKNLDSSSGCTSVLKKFGFLRKKYSVAL